MPLLSIFISFLALITSNTISKEKHLLAFDKEHYYNVFASNDLNLINSELTLFTSNSSYLAFEGALIMKKAGIVGSPKEKLALFKDGKTKLETAIKNNPSKIEFLFLRYMIQENSPGFLGYNTNLEEDKKKFITHYPNFEPVVQKAIRDYSKTSKTLSSIQF